jgi:hypothetical protein
MPDPIKKTTSYDPSTGETTFKASWSGSNSGISRGNITPKTTQRTVAARQISNPASKIVASRSESAGHRMAVAFKSPTPAPAKDMELKSNADMKSRAPQSIQKEKLKVKAKYDSEAFDKKVMEMYPGKTLEKATEKYYNVKNRQDKKGEREAEKDWQSRVGGSNGKNKSGACRTC